MVVRSGALRHNIIFQQMSETRSPTGGVAITWSDITSPDERVQIIPLKGEERYASARINSTIDHKIRCRFRSDIDNKMRIIFGSRIFDIDSIIDPYEKNKELHIMCSEKLGEVYSRYAVFITSDDERFVTSDGKIFKVVA